MEAATRPHTAAERQAHLRQALVEQAVASTSALVGFVALLYRYSPDVLAHVQRVATTSLSIGFRLALPATELKQVERAALVHDLGKIVVPEDLTGEWNERHTDLRRVRQVIAAHEVLSAAPFLKPAADIVGALCERVDGSGWPYGLKDHAIPLGARILSVADAFDVLTEFCAKVMLSPEVIAAELARHAGTRFDAQVVAACVQWMDAEPSDQSAWPSQLCRTI